MSKRFLKVKEVAEIFGISTQAVYSWIKNKGLKWCKVSTKGTRIRPTWLHEYLIKQRDLDRLVEFEDYLYPKVYYRSNPFEVKQS